ncbi:uncharacterized protein N0V89_000331 [Didymosphaeria variabile]|uniref:Formin GTPase-binding domain-containing protein n=1 Tax=Didymosphaeria variabile TaxID=1932322 RepID=A0A9W8XWI5_9PLEO|nr:uncharacterized protein N0V89_000331 [Didymosphaeria variabile]KAJ4359775.1 hypothetical protein N0V89_000331 [Didymosphaeria variabile]
MPAPTEHRRNKSAMLKSIVLPGHRRTPSDGTALKKEPHAVQPYAPQGFVHGAPLLPPDHPHSQQRAANHNLNIPIDPPVSPHKSQDTREGRPKGLHKKTLSSVSLRTLGKDKEKEKTKESRSREPSRTRQEDLAKSHKKTKSRTNLRTLFGKDKQAQDVKETRDKENTTPPGTSDAGAPLHTPIWAEFSSRPLQEVTTTSKVPLNDQRRSIEEEIALYTPSNYSPSKGRNFFDNGLPSLQKKSPVKERPKSFLGSGSTPSLFETFTRKKSDDRVPLGDTKGNEGRTKDSPSKSLTPRPPLVRANTDNSRESIPQESTSPKKTSNAEKRQSRVMAAVAAFNGKSKQTEKGTPATSPIKLDPKMVDAEFEEVLESRQIPNHQRAAMRTLKLEVKADFVRTHKLDTPSVSRTTSANSGVAGRLSAKTSLSRSTKSRAGSTEEEKVPLEDNAGGTSKRERPRSRTFGFTRSDSPTKKQKGEKEQKSTAIPKSPSMRSLASVSSQRSVSKGSKTVSPDEFINYLKKTPKPQAVEVGKLHKLRLLLRNEPVEWVHQFIVEGGMTELVGLLHRIMEVEWREDHEDTLLHELLRCLKGLCTADIALKQFAEISSTLFPALLGMLFDEEHKGPSEFTTREFIIQIIFAHLSMASESELHTRATGLMEHLKDPVKEKQASTVPFVLQMRQPRPYQVWCKEITNVTKEVFWIFIHHLNVVPISPSSDEPPMSYAKTHFPGQRAIVPAAPYVGGVEWDATNYIATHLDLLNGILASLPTREARNTFRSELKVSGFEKVMGHLRTCNPKYYGAVHDAVKVWVGAALEDDWPVRDVRMGPPDGKPGVGSPIKQSPKKKAEKPPQIQAPKVEIGGGLGLGFEKEIAIGGNHKIDDDWI